MCCIHSNPLSHLLEQHIKLQRVSAVIETIVWTNQSIENCFKLAHTANQTQYCSSTCAGGTVTATDSNQPSFSHFLVLCAVAQSWSSTQGSPCSISSSGGVICSVCYSYGVSEHNLGQWWGNLFCLIAALE